jgi:hypothetical protein
VAPSPWANFLTVGLKILTAILGGGTGGDGIDKVDNGSPMQVSYKKKLVKDQSSCGRSGNGTSSKAGSNTSKRVNPLPSPIIFMLHVNTIRYTNEG